MPAVQSVYINNGSVTNQHPYSLHTSSQWKLNGRECKLFCGMDKHRFSVPLLMTHNYHVNGKSVSLHDSFCTEDHFGSPFLIFELHRILFWLKTQQQQQ